MNGELPAQRVAVVYVSVDNVITTSLKYAAAFGMNLPSIPWANTHGGFWWAIGLCAVVVAGCWAALKRYGIL